MSPQTADGRFAMLVATADYQDESLTQLRAPKADVAALGEVLSDAAIGGFDVAPALIDRPSYEISAEIERFFSNRRHDDLLLLYLSCHGVLSPRRQLYFAAANTRRDLLKATGVPASLLAEVMHDTRARRVILVLDCCHSGAFSRSVATKGDTQVGIEQQLAQGQGEGRVTLTASDELEFAFEEETATGIGAPYRSVFTDALVTGLKNGDADRNRDGRISLDELYDYLCAEVRRRDPNQTPGLSGDFRGDIFIARAPTHALQPLPKEIQAATTSPFAGMRVGAVHALAHLAATADDGLADTARAALTRLSCDDSREVSAAAERALGGRETIEESPAPATRAPARRRGAISPIADHANLTAAQIAAHLPHLSPKQLRKARTYEQSHANRKTVLRAIESRLKGGGPVPPKVAEIRSIHADDLRPTQPTTWQATLVEGRKRSTRTFHIACPWRPTGFTLQVKNGVLFDELILDGKSLQRNVRMGLLLTWEFEFVPGRPSDRGVVTASVVTASTALSNVCLRVNDTVLYEE